MQSEAVNQWLDTEQVMTIAEGLLEKSPQGEPIPNEKMFGSSFVGFERISENGNSMSTVARKSLSDAQSRAASSGIIRDANQAVSSSVTAEPKKKSEATEASSELAKKEPSPFSVRPNDSPESVQGPDLSKAVEAAKQVTSASGVSVTSKDSVKLEEAPKSAVEVTPVISRKIATPVRVIQAKKSKNPASPPEEPKADKKVDESSEKSAKKNQSVELEETSPKVEVAEEAESMSSKKALMKPESVTKTPEQPSLGARSTTSKKPDLVASPFKIASKPKRVTKPAPAAADAFRPVPLSTRLQAFGDWLKEQIPTRAYFICDRHGEIVVDEVGSEKLVKVARTLAHASSSAVRQVGNDENLGSLHVKIGPDRVMEVIPRHSHFGLVVLGVIVPRPLSRDAVASVSRALGTALAEPSAPRE